MTDSIAFLATELEKSNQERQSLEERVSDLALRLDAIGWEPLQGWDPDGGGLSLDALKRTSEMLQDMVATASLMKRAAELRHGYVFGRGISYTNAKPRHQAIMDKPFNKKALFSMPAYEELMKWRLTDGNIFVLRDKTTGDAYRIPLKEITGYVADPMSSERVWYLQRTYNKTVDGRTNKVTEWYPTSDYEGTVASSIDSGNGKAVTVNKKYQMVFFAFNRQPGFTFGVPDGYAAITWAKAYGEYLKNNSKLVKAYAQIAWKASTKSASGGNNVAAQISQPGVAGTATMGPTSDLTPMPRAGSDVNFENGRPLASMVAAALGVSVVALTADPGAAGSSYGSAQTLDAPTILVMVSIQEAWKAFYEEFFRPWQPKKNEEARLKVEFPSIETDPVYRQIQSLNMAYAAGALFQAEWRAAVLDLLDIADPKDGLPVPDNFNAGHLTPQEVQDAADKLAAQNNASDPVPRQGNSGNTGGDQGETNHDGDPDSFGNEG